MLNTGRTEDTQEIKKLLCDVVHNARSVMDALIASSSKTSTKGTCLHASVLLAGMLKRAGFNVEIQGGDGNGDGGIFTPDGNFGHYWCEINHDDDMYVADITADQFGFNSVIIDQKGSGRIWPRYIPGNKDATDVHINFLLKGTDCID